MRRDSRTADFAGLVVPALIAAVLRWWPLPDLVLCPFRLLSGLPCPLCGLTRAMAALLHGDWLGAWQLHPFSFVLAAALAWTAARSFARFTGARCPVTPAWLVPLAAAALLAFGLGRMASAAL